MKIELNLTHTQTETLYHILCHHDAHRLAPGMSTAINDNLQTALDKLQLVLGDALEPELEPKPAFPSMTH